MKNSYDHKAIEAKWKVRWKDEKLYETPDRAEGKQNFYALVEFPYPSGNLHTGHWYAFAVPDIFTRFKRMSGFNVLYPIGFDSFGLPAENAAIKRGLDPRKWTYENIEHMEGQLEAMGAMFDWSRAVRTSDPDFYKWTQWIFAKFFDRGLAYKKAAQTNWCPSCQTVLANEQVVAGRCERCGAEVEQKEVDQWFMKISDYADRLIDDLDELQWPEEIKEQQRNWIGRSEGARIDFAVTKGSEQVTVFTTRPDTLFGATYLVLAPEHPLIHKLENEIENMDEVRQYVVKSQGKTELERMSEGKEKTGVTLKGIAAVNPATKEEIPVFVADYVLGGYGTGAIMAVPAHDERDFEFAQKFGLPVKEVVVPTRIDMKNPPVQGKESVERSNVHVVVKNPKDGKVIVLKWKKFPWTTFPMGGVEPGESILNAAEREVLEETGYKNLVNGKILGGQVRAEYFAAHKDQNRIAYTHLVTFDLADEEREEISKKESDTHEIHWVDMKDLTPEFMTHAEMDVWLSRLSGDEGPYTGSGVLVNSGEFSGLSSEEAKEKIVESVGGKMTKTYRLRDWSIGRQRYWGCPIPIVYDPEGQPHAIPEEHLPWLLPDDVDHTPTGEAPLARSKELKERTEKIFGKGWTPETDTMDTFVDSSWYYLRYLDPHNEKEFSEKTLQSAWMPVDQYFGGAEHTTLHLLYSRFVYKALHDMNLVTGNEPYARRLNHGLILGPDGQKMSKSRGNVIDPDEYVERVGADAVRMYLAFIGPYNEAGAYPWDMGGVVGVRRFLERVWSLREKVVDEDNDALASILHKTIKRVGEDIGAFKFNTAISAMMEFVNAVTKEGGIGKKQYEALLQLLAPFAPYLCEDLWHEIGETDRESVHMTAWPPYDPALTVDETAVIAVQVNGKVRAELTASRNSSQGEIEAQAFSLAAVKKWIENKEPLRVIYVPGKILNIVVK